MFHKEKQHKYNAKVSFLCVEKWQPLDLLAENCKMYHQEDGSVVQKMHGCTG
jgi:hypothetical protein